MGDRWGLFVENLVAPAVSRLFQERGIAVKETFRRMQSERLATPMEIDIFVVDDDEAVVVEVKSRCSRQDVDEFLQKLERFKQAFRHFSAYRVYGSVAAIEFDHHTDRYAYQKGLFVIRQAGDSVELANDQTFRPRTW